MSTKLVEPVIKTNRKVIERWSFSGEQGRVIFRSQPECSARCFLDVLEKRRSADKFGDIKLEALSDLFYYSLRTKFTWADEFGTLEKRNVPSAGSLHSISAFVSNFGSDDWYLYNSQFHALDLIPRETTVQLSSFKQKCFEVIQEQCFGCLVWYVCDLDLLEAKYDNAETLALRESGGIASIQNLIAEYLGYSYRTIGLLGCEEAKLLSSKRNLLGVGSSIIGGCL